ncbi:MAG: PQQ-binding-like beta-propeller repeat protein, partial [Phycisphaerae bacterium]
YVTHSEENHDSTAMGRVVCINATRSGNVTQSGEVWRVDGYTAGYSSPALANGRLYSVTNSATLTCFDARTGAKHWEYKLGRVMKGSPVVTADGVIYTGTVNGRFHILRDEGDKCVSLDEEMFSPRGGAVVEINGSPIVAGGRVYFMTAYDTYCLGKPGQSVVAERPRPMPEEVAPDRGRPAIMQIVPMDVTVHPGERRVFRTRVFDAAGRLVGERTAAWSVDGVAGIFDRAGSFVADRKNAFSAGLIRADAGELFAEARVRISPVLPIRESFNEMKLGKPPPGWIGVDLRTQIIEKDGTRVLHKLAKSPSAPYSRMRAFSIPPVPAGYTVQADLMAEPRRGRRPVLSDMGLINARYKLILLGYEKHLRIVSYSPIPRLQEETPFNWKPQQWYRAKLRVDLRGDEALVRGKVWPRDSTEPAGWTLEVIDPSPNREGSPGLYAYSKGTRPGRPGSSVFFDNFQVTRND